MRMRQTRENEMKTTDIFWIPLFWRFVLRSHDSSSSMLQLHKITNSDLNIFILNIHYRTLLAMYMHTPAEYVKNVQTTCQKAYSWLLGAAGPILHYGSQNEVAVFSYTMMANCQFSQCHACDLCHEFSLLWVVSRHEVRFDITNFRCSTSGPPPSPGLCPKCFLRYMHFVTQLWWLCSLYMCEAQKPYVGVHVHVYVRHNIQTRLEIHVYGTYCHFEMVWVCATITTMANKKSIQY